MRAQTSQAPGKADAQPASRASTGVLQRKCACGQHNPGGGECESCRRKHAAASQVGTLQRVSVGASPVAVPRNVYDVLSSPGQPLDSATRVFMETRFAQVDGAPAHATVPAVPARLAVGAPDDAFERE